MWCRRPDSYDERIKKVAMAKLGSPKKYRFSLEDLYKAYNAGVFKGLSCETVGDYHFDNLKEFSQYYNKLIKNKII